MGIKHASNITDLIYAASTESPIEIFLNQRNLLGRIQTGVLVLLKLKILTEVTTYLYGVVESLLNSLGVRMFPGLRVSAMRNNGHVKSAICWAINKRDGLNFN